MSEFPAFLRVNDIPLYVYILHLFIHSSISGHLGFFYVLAIVNNAAISRGVQISVEVLAFISFGYMHRSGILGSYGNPDFFFFFFFLRHCCVVFYSSCHCTFLTIVHIGSSFSTSLLNNTCYFLVGFVWFAIRIWVLEYKSFKF